MNRESNPWLDLLAERAGAIASLDEATWLLRQLGDLQRNGETLMAEHIPLASLRGEARVWAATPEHARGLARNPGIDAEMVALLLDRWLPLIETAHRSWTPGHDLPAARDIVSTLARRGLLPAERVQSLRAVVEDEVREAEGNTRRLERLRTIVEILVVVPDLADGERARLLDTVPREGRSDLWSEVAALPGSGSATWEIVRRDEGRAGAHAIARHPAARRDPRWGAWLRERALEDQWLVPTLLADPALPGRIELLAAAIRRFPEHAEEYVEVLEGSAWRAMPRSLLLELLRHPSAGVRECAGRHLHLARDEELGRGARR